MLLLEAALSSAVVGDGNRGGVDSGAGGTHSGAGDMLWIKVLVVKKERFGSRECFRGKFWKVVSIGERLCVGGGWWVGLWKGGFCFKQQ